MRLSFKEAMSLARLLESETPTFIFTGKGYNFPAASLFSKFLERLTKKPIAYHEELGAVSEDDVNLFQTQDAEDLDTFLLRKTGCLRVIPMKENKYTTKAKWGRLVEDCVIVEVKAPTEKSISTEISFACSLMGVNYDEDGLNAAAASTYGGWSGILSIVEQAMLMKGGLIGKDSVIPVVDSEDKGYMGFKDTLLFGLPKDIADSVMNTPNHLEYANRIVDEMATFYNILRYDKQEVSATTIATEFRINEWFLRNRLLPRLRTMGTVRILNFIDKVSETIETIMDAKSPDPQAQLASVIMLMVCT